MISLALTLLLTGSAHAAPAPPPLCRAAAPLDREALSVAWIAPATRHVLPWTRVSVIPTRELRERASAAHASSGRLLQLVGARRAATPPRRSWIAVVFDVSADHLCRPVDADRAGGERFGGVALCESGARGVGLRDDDCGRLIDRATGKTALPVFRIRWRDAAARGFCALPIERFLRGQ